ncbi:ER lumen protein retaining receptor-domain-containing protein [Trichophaea hybrida]|nr:ER lumen protein retaining receptor-domain-containing protein [Trichophaea hybrida]
MVHFNVFRILGDLSHLLSKAILIFTVHHHKSAEGVSLLTQALYALVFLTRYLDLFSKYALNVLYNFLFKITYIATSFYILFLMFRIYPRSRESENQWKLTIYILCFSTATAPILYLIFKGRSSWDTLGLFRHFSWILESLAVLPQLTLLAHTSVPTVINSYYLVALGSYRALYIPNWIVRYAHNEHPSTVSVIFGVLQTALYVEFLWIYVNRQKVKLRGGGGVLDGEEFARGLCWGDLLGGMREGRGQGKPGEGGEGVGLVLVRMILWWKGKGKGKGRKGVEVRMNWNWRERGMWRGG